jgi:Alpha/beta hydrolase family
MGGKWLRKPQDQTSVVFVHGILSSGDSCWRHPKGAYWPELLAESSELKPIGIYVVTYQSNAFSGTYRLGDVVDALKEDLRLDGVLSCERIIFVCHSMGGIVVRKFIVERSLELLQNRTEIGLFLVASPSLGASYANLLSPLARIFGHTQAEALQFAEDNTWLNDLDKEFRNLKESRRVFITGKELVEDRFFIFRQFLRKQVVEPFSGARYFGDHLKVAGTDHFSIAKPESADSIQHRLLVQFILDLTKRSSITGPTRTNSTTLQEAVSDWLAAAREARKSATIGYEAALPVQLQAARSKFEAAWISAGFTERQTVEPKILWEALSAAIRTYRLAEYDSRQKNSSLYWVDQAIGYYDQIQNRTHLVEALLDKAAIFLELTQLDHTDAQEFQKITRDGDKVMSRTAGLCDDLQKAVVMRMWSRFYYNLARPRSNKLSENWSNTYLSLAVDKASEARELAPTDIRNSTQFSRAAQKFASNPPQDTDPAWTIRLRDAQKFHLALWNENKDKLQKTIDRIPPLDILGVMTSELVLREWLEASSDREGIAHCAVAAMNEVALPALREAYALVRNTELHGRYSFDLAYDLARAHAVLCQIYGKREPSKADSACSEAVELMREARTTASATQLDAALQSLDTHPTLARLASDCRNAIRVVLAPNQ